MHHAWLTFLAPGPRRHLASSNACAGYVLMQAFQAFCHEVCSSLGFRACHFVVLPTCRYGERLDLDKERVVRTAEEMAQEAAELRALFL